MGTGRDRLAFHGSLARQVVDEAELIRTGGAGGRLLAVTGTAQSGRSTLLWSLADGFERAGWRVVARQVRDGALVAPRGAGLRRAGWAIQAAKVAGAGLQVVGGPAGSLVALVAELATACHMAAGEQAADTGDEYVQLARLTVALERTAASAPVALLIDDADDLDRPDVWWDVLFGAQIPDLVAELPLVCVIGAERSSVARGSHAWDVLDALLTDGVAAEVRLGPLDRAAVTEALGAVDPTLADQLLTLAQRRPGWVAGLWESWCEEDLVVRRDGRWEFGTDGYARARATSVHRWVETSLRASVPDRTGYDRAVEILELGSLEGPHFTAEVVAAMLSEDVEDLIDWLDDTLSGPEEDDGTSVLVEDGFVARSGGEPLCRYRFRSLLAAGTLREKVLRSTNGASLAGRYARTLAGTYRWSAPGEAATAVVRLATHAGDTELVEETWARANRLAGVGEAARLGGFLAKRLERKSLSTDELAVGVRRLNEVNGVIRGRWDTEETARLCTVALAAARTLVGADAPGASGGRSEHVPVLVDALRLIGGAAANDGDWVAGARFRDEAAAWSATTADHLRTATLLRLVGHTLAVAGGDTASAAKAVARLRRALEYAGRDGSRSAVIEKARIYATLSETFCRPPPNYAEAAQNLQHSVSALRSLGVTQLNHEWGVPTLLLSVVDLAVGRGDDVTCGRFTEMHLTHRLDAAGQIPALVTLSLARLDRPADAAFAACQALRLAQERGRHSEAWALYALSKCAACLGVGSTAMFAQLSCARLSSSIQDQEFASELLDRHRDEFAALDDEARDAVEEAYARDRGVGLVRAAFGIDMAEVDRANARLGQATVADLRRHLDMVAEYAAQVITEETPTTP